MKKIILTASILAISTLYSPVSKADDVSLRICEYVAVNDKNRLRSFLKNKKLKIRKIFKNIQCNGKNLLVFSAENQALDAGEFIIGQLPKKIVSENLDEITKHSAHLAEDAKDRIN